MLKSHCPYVWWILFVALLVVFGDFVDQLLTHVNQISLNYEPEGLRKRCNKAKQSHIAGKTVCRCVCKGGFVKRIWPLYQP